MLKALEFRSWIDGGLIIPDKFCHGAGDTSNTDGNEEPSVD